jgi:ADP-ribose pyrophosphatase YjhB (NUDIX family)
MSRKAVRAIVIKDNNLLVMARNKFGQEYLTLPGGGVQLGETPEQALVREITEETGVSIIIERLVFVEEAGLPYGTQYVYLCSYNGGEPALSPDSDEAKINQLGVNLYEPLWIPLSEVADKQFKSEHLKEVVLQAAKTSFPEKAVLI